MKFAGAITGAIQGVTTSEQFKNWTSGNGFRSDDVVKAEQERVANMKALLPQAQSSDGAMGSAMRAQQATGSGVAGQMGAELQGDPSFGWKGVYNDIKVSLNAQLNSTESITGKGIEWVSDINLQQIKTSAEWVLWSAGYAFDLWKGPYVPVQVYPPPPGVSPEVWYDSVI